MPRLSSCRLIQAAVTASIGTLVACSEQPAAAPKQGKLWPYRDEIASGLVPKRVTLGSHPDNGIYNAFTGPGYQCGHFWRTGDPDRAGTLPALCDQQARDLRAFAEKRFSQSLTLEDVRDPALWEYLMPRIERKG